MEDTSEEVIELTDTAIPPAEEVEESEEEPVMEMSLTSPAFNAGDPIPIEYSCDGEDDSPDLDWFGIPKNTQSLALIMDDPDAPVGTWIHWVLFNLPADMPGLQKGITGVGVDGSNSWDKTGYGGPCPPGGTHRYFFKLYALDITLDLSEGATKADLLAAMEGHILGQAELMGTYTR
jgi:Raf kinase inhibitor-like YbhB/YbcL family protein